MKIAELFVALGFKVEGNQTLTSLEDALNKGARAGAKMAAAADLVAAGLTYVIDTALSTAARFEKFHLATGLSTAELQKWEHAAALANVTAQELESSIKGIQIIQANMRLSGEGATPWAILGIRGTDDPFTVYKRLHEVLIGVDKDRIAMARRFTQEAGFSDEIFQFLSRKDLHLDDLKEMYILQGQNFQNLLKLNQQWQNLIDLVGRAKTQFIGVLGPAIGRLLGGLTDAADKFAEFTHWLDSGSDSAGMVKDVLGGTAAALLVLGPLLTAVAGGYKLLAFAAGLLNATISPEVAAFTAMAGAIYLVVEAVKSAVQAYSAWNALRKQEGAVTAFLDAVGFGSRVAPVPAHQDAVDALRRTNSGLNPAGSSSPTTINMTNKFEVNGARDPMAVRDEILKAQKRLISDATYALPVAAH
jgi:hypothetical protein